MRGVVWWLSEASMRRVCFPACLLVTYGDSWAFILLESAQGSSRKGTWWVRGCVGTGRGYLAGRAGLFGGSRKPTGAEFVFPVVISLCGAALGLFIWSKFPS